MQRIQITKGSPGESPYVRGRREGYQSGYEDGKKDAKRVSVDAVVMHPVFVEDKEPLIGDYYFCKVWFGEDSSPEKRIIEWGEFKNVAGGAYMDWDIDPEERESITKIEWLDEGA